MPSDAGWEDLVEIYLSFQVERNWLLFMHRSNVLGCGENQSASKLVTPAGGDSRDDYGVHCLAMYRDCLLQV